MDKPRFCKPKTTFIQTTGLRQADAASDAGKLNSHVKFFYILKHSKTINIYLQFLTTEVMPFCAIYPKCVALVSQAIQVHTLPNSDKKDRLRVNLNQNASNLLVVGSWEEVVSLIPLLP